jgi:hypothetical protein
MHAIFEKLQDGFTDLIHDEIVVAGQIALDFSQGSSHVTFESV